MASNGLVIPSVIDGKPTWVPYSEGIQERMRKGDPGIGWEGDERLYVTPRNGAEGYAVGRLNEDGTKTLICTSEPPHVLDEDLLVWLRDHDTRRVNVLEKVEKHNARVRKEADEHMKERVKEAYERVVFGLKKDVGGLY